MYDKIKNNVQQSIDKGHKITFTTNSRTFENTTEPFVSLTAHWINNDNSSDSVQFSIACIVTAVTQELVWLKHFPICSQTGTLTEEEFMLFCKMMEPTLLRLSEILRFVARVVLCILCSYAFTMHYFPSLPKKH